jgi:anaphase-promoting complex subunit 2
MVRSPFIQYIGPFLSTSHFDLFLFFLIFQMFCIAEPSYDKSLQQLQSFLSGLVADEKLETRDGLYLLKR